ncbi:hypothetical protein HanIR_Chr01g0009681 [Helianthus annuus]|nr:hypothetical protein HanIR_Chr01g0009681 [Helianthus annuus]
MELVPYLIRGLRRRLVAVVGLSFEWNGVGDESGWRKPSERGFQNNW